jgi:hypothetical protein
MFNPRAWFAKHVKWSDLGERYVEKMIRQETARDRETYRGKKVSRCDSYRSHIPTYVRTLLRNNGLDRSQNVRDLGVDRRMIKVVKPPFVIPTILTEAKG